VSGLLVAGAGSVATLAGGLRRGAAQADAAALDGGDLAVACWGGRVLAVGPAADVYRQIVAAGHSPAEFEHVDADGGLITPGLIDAHTHLIFAGTREQEWQMRAHGAGYLEVLAAGGGILSTVAATRDASDERLLSAARGRLDEMLACGTTTAEAKSGYGLDVAAELRLLRIIGQLEAEGPMRLVPTYLGAHAVPEQYRGRPDGTDEFVAEVVDRQLPQVAAQGIAEFCDVFCERGVFSANQTARILAAATSLGMRTRIHADELAPSGGAELAAGSGCLSADHLAAPSDAGVAALARAAASPNPVVATLLPATSWFLGKHHFAPARRFIDAGIPVALATDLNPGTSPTVSLPLVMSIACVEMGLSPAEALVAVTVNAAHSLGLGSEIGSIEPGRQADLVVWNVPTFEQLPYWLGTRPARTVIVGGRVVAGRA
jgi:imidazolonepropionase